MSQHESGSSKQNPAETTEDTHQPTVLLAEDDSDFRETFRLWLDRDGLWNVIEASNGEEALTKLDPSVDLLVLDRKMPNLSGPEVVERLSEHPFEGTVMVVSAFEPDRHLNAEMVADYLTKPVSREEFLETLDRHV